jgi:hypothetical protein
MKPNDSQDKVGKEIVRLRFYSDLSLDEKLSNDEFRDKDFDEDEVFHLVTNTQGEIREQAEKLVKKNLGNEFFITDIEINRGSIEIILIIGGVIGSTYVGMSKYKNFVESIELLQKQLRSMLAGHMRIPSSLIDINWIRGKYMGLLVQSVKPKKIPFMNKIKTNIKDWWNRKRGKIGPPKNIRIKSFFSGALFLNALLFFIWSGAQFFDGASTIKGFVDGFGLGSLLGIVTGSVVIGMLVIYPFLFRFIPFKVNKKKWFFLIFMVIIAHLVSAMSTSRYILDNLGHGLDYNERHELYNIVKDTRESINMRIDGLKKTINIFKIAEKMAEEEFLTGRYSTGRSGHGAKWEELREGFEQKSQAAKSAEACLNKDCKTKIIEINEFDPYDEAKKLSDFNILYNKLPECIKKDIDEPRIVTEPSRFEKAVRAAWPFSDLNKEKKLVSIASWSSSIILEIFVSLLGLMIPYIHDKLKIKTDFNESAFAAWAIANDFLCSNLTFLRVNNDSYYKYQTDITTTILYLASKRIVIEKKTDKQEMYRLNFEDRNTIKLSNLEEAVDAFWKRTLIIMLNSKQALKDDEDIYINGDLFIRWVDKVVSLRQTVGFEAVNNFSNYLREKIDMEGAHNTFKIHQDFIS